MFTDMIYLSHGIEEHIFALDTNNVFLLNPKSLEVQYIYEVNYKEPQLTCIAGRFSRTNSTFNIYIGDEIGVVRIFDFKELLLLVKEISLFKETYDNKIMHKTKKLD